MLPNVLWISEEDVDQVRYAWRWNDKKRCVERTGRKHEGETGQIYLAKIIVERKLGRALIPNEFDRVRYLKDGPGPLPDGIDSRRCNLTRDNLEADTGYRGVGRAGKKFRAMVWDRAGTKRDGRLGKLLHSRRFKTAEEAAIEHDRMMINLHGVENARLNFPEMWQ